MKLTPREVDHLLLHQAGFVAQKRLARGVKLNYPESVALIATQALEFIRDGKSVSEIMQLGTQLLGHSQVSDGVASILTDVQVEGTFPDGTKLVTIHNPIRLEDGDLELALYGSFLPVPSVSISTSTKEANKTFGQYILKQEDIILNAGRTPSRLKVTNVGDRPVQIGSHYHLIEANPCLEMDRMRAYGHRLSIPAGTAIRFEPGDAKTVDIIPISGNKVIAGGNNVATGSVTVDNQEAAMTQVLERGFKHRAEDQTLPSAPLSIPRFSYAATYGPTTGDKIRLADTTLVIEIEKDFTSYGDECVFGGGKVLRDGMGQYAGDVVSSTIVVVDTVITNAIVLDYTGIYKADIGIKDGHICNIGKAGNPDVMPGVTMIVGCHTEAISAEGLIVTAGGFDAHVHFICPQLLPEALCSGVTTLLGGGTGPATGSKATTCTPSPSHIKMMLQSTDAFPLNIGLTGKGNASSADSTSLQQVVDAGAVGLKLHEDWGTTPAAINACLNVAEANDIQVTIHTDTLNESCCLEGTLDALNGRTIHTYHSEGAGGGHAPDIIRVVAEPNVIPSSTNPTRPYTTNTIDEHLDMLMVCHHLNKNIKEDVAFAESRIRGETIAAEDILHDVGAISIISSDSQAMGRIGEVISRTWQTADKMKRQRGPLAPMDDENKNDNYRVRRYVAKYTINPALAHGMAHRIGSVEVGKLADLCLWDPAFFGAKVETVIKGGVIVCNQMGDANASIPTPQPVLSRPMFGSYGTSSIGNTSIAFVSPSSIEKGIPKSYNLSKSIEAVKNCRSVRKSDMKLNNTIPSSITVDPETYVVKMDGQEIKCDPTSHVPLSQNYFLF